MSDDATARLGLPYLAAGQMQKHVTLNESLTRLDALVQTAVKSRTRADQPADAADGDLYILPADAAGAAWASKTNGTLMRFEAGGWRAVSAPDGLVVLVLDADEVWLRDGDWRRLGERLGAVQDIARLGLNAAADASNPFLAKLNAALWTALETGSGGDGDLRVAFNKQSAGDSLSLLFQSGYGARAELGLLGDDDLRLKVSADGTVWHAVTRVDRATGRAWFDQGATRRETTILATDGDYALPAWARTIRVLAVGGGGGGGAGAFGVSGLRHGGGGGGAGGVALADWPADQIGAGLHVQIGAAGLGGVAAPGEDGGDSTLHCGASLILTAQGGGGGGLGDAASGAAGRAGANGNRGGRGLSASAAEDGLSLDRPDGGGGGGGGGVLDAAGVARAGGAGGLGGAHACPAPGGAAGSGWSGGGGWSAPWPQMGFAGGGGGGGSAHASSAGYAGGDAGSHGAGGGGGGAGVSSGGAGGDGAPGVVWITAIG